MDTFKLIKTRRSIRKYTDEPVSDGVVDSIIEAGIWAPSGLNNQPWRFAVIRDKDLKERISELTHYKKIVLRAQLLIAVFLDKGESYDRTKDVMAVGACVQNMLLFIHSQGLGGVWLGEILKNKQKVRELVRGGENLELMAVVAIGHPAEKGGKPGRKGLEETVFFKK